MIQELDVISAMRTGTDYRHPVRVRGFQVFLRPITIAEQMQIASVIIEEMESLPASAKNALTENLALAKKTLIYASTSAPDKLDFKITDKMCDAMTADELMALFKQYNGVVEKVNPMLEQLPREVIEQMVLSVKKNPAALTQLSLMELVNLCQHLLGDSPTDK